MKRQMKRLLAFMVFTAVFFPQTAALVLLGAFNCACVVEHEYVVNDDCSRFYIAMSECADAGDYGQLCVVESEYDGTPPALGSCDCDVIVTQNRRERAEYSLVSAHCLRTPALCCSGMAEIGAICIFSTTLVSDKIRLNN
jgi:hypothetical protein